MKNERDIKRLQLEKVLGEAGDLSTLEGNPGWAVVKKGMEDSIKTLQAYIFQTAKVKNWNDYLFYKAEYNVYTKILAVIEMKMRREEEARKQLEELKNDQS